MPTLTDVQSIVLVGPNGVTEVTFSKAVGPVVSIPDGDTSANADLEAVLGVAGDGTPYFNVEGAAEGEHAVLSVDVSGGASLTTTGD